MSLLRRGESEPDQVTARIWLPNKQKRMSNIVTFLAAVMFLTLLLVACAPNGTASPPPLPTPTRTPVRLGPTSTASPAPPMIIPASPPPTLIPIPPISDDDWSRGPLEASVTILMYADFQDPYCALLAPVLIQLHEWHAEDLRIIYRHFPLLSIYDKASLAGQAAEAAGAQGSFWPMHDLLYARYGEWINLSPEDFHVWLITAATDLELDLQQFQDELDGEHYTQVMQDAFQDVAASGIPGIPYMFINGLLYRLPLDLVNLEASVRLEILAEQQYDSYPPMILEEGTRYLAYLKLNTGEVIIQLYPDDAPIAVNSFIFLAREGWFDGNPFYRVLPGVLVESGDPSGTGFGGPGYHFTTEINEALTFDVPGMVALSSTGPGTNGSQFFITLSPLPELNNSRTIFGRIIQGLDLLQSLIARQPMDDLLTPPQAVILSITIEVQ